VWLGLYAGAAAAAAALCKHHAADAADAAPASPDAAAARAGGTPSSVTSRVAAYERRTAARRAGLPWLGPLGNGCALAALLLCQWLNLEALEGTARGVLGAAPLLLLLHPHVLPCTALNRSNRYAPLATAVAASLLCAAAAELVRRAEADAVGAARGLLLVGCALPSLLACLLFLWTRRQQPALWLWCALPLNSVPLLLSHHRPMYDLGAAGMLAGVVHLALARRARREGLKYI